MSKTGIWAGPKVKKDPRRTRPPRTGKPILLKGLWHELTAKHRKRLVAMNFDEHTWNNNVREQLKPQGFEMWGGGGSNLPRTYEVMTDDRACRILPPVAAYEGR